MFQERVQLGGQHTATDLVLTIYAFTILGLKGYTIFRPGKIVSVSENEGTVLVHFYLAGERGGYFHLHNIFLESK